MLFYLTNQVLEITWGATWWLTTKTASGLYNGGYYLLYGSEITDEDMKQIVVIDDCEKETELYNNLISEIKELKQEISSLKKD